MHKILIFLRSSVKVKEDSSPMETGAYDEKKEPAWEKKYRIIS